MAGQKAFTLIEIIVVLIIIGIMILFSVPSYYTFVQQGAGKAAQNNLITIYNAEKNNYFSNNAYCIDTSANPCDNRADINTNLSLNINDTNNNYTCITDASGFKCTATNIADINMVLTLTNNPIVLPGGTGTANPSCAGSTNCPS